MEWLRGDLGDEDFPLPAGLAHIDCYGVLHHLPRPAAALKRFGRLLAPGGTARIMIYNSAARGWIRHLQSAFAWLGLRASEADDLETARRLLAALADASPPLRDRLGPMRENLSNPARLVDTFFHAREARLGLAYWLEAIAAAGLEPIGLFDRYGELDDLANPLLEMPDAPALEARIGDRRCEGNLELFLAKPGPPRGPAAPVRLPSAHILRGPPESWWGYRETCRLPWHLRLSAWRHFLANVAGRAVQADAWAARLPPEACARLARLGAVLPDECASRELQAILRGPLEAAMEPPDFPTAADLRSHSGLRALVHERLRGKPGAERRAALVMARLDAAQRP
jgi:SAM-dependent methyltransferase